jgi:acylphosphatase
MPPSPDDAADHDAGRHATDHRTARSLVVDGRVQGVFFRSSTKQVAERHGLHGWAENRSDGTVAIWLEGGPDEVAAVEAWVRDGGPASAIVDTVRAADEVVAGHDGFVVRG